MIRMTYFDVQFADDVPAGFMRFVPHNGQPAEFIDVGLADITERRVDVLCSGFASRHGINSDVTVYLSSEDEPMFTDSEIIRINEGVSIVDNGGSVTISGAFPGATLWQLRRRQMQQRTAEVAITYADGVMRITGNVDSVQGTGGNAVVRMKETMPRAAAWGQEARPRAARLDRALEEALSHE